MCQSEYLDTSLGTFSISINIKKTARKTVNLVMNVMFK